MRTLIICPSERKSVEQIAESGPIATLCIFNKPLVCHWIEYLVTQGARAITIAAADRPQEIRACVGDGSRWGITIDIQPASHELNPQEAREIYQTTPSQWLVQPLDIVVADHLPSFDQGLFHGYNAFFQTAKAVLGDIPRHIRHVGLREIKPGVWAGLHSRISPTAKLHAPCWIGDHASVGDQAVIGPHAILESRVFVDVAAEITNSFVSAETFVGAYTQIEDSLAFGSTLINWKTGSCVKVPDSFLLSSLKQAPEMHRPNVLSRFAAILAMIATSPLALAWVSAVRMKGQNVLLRRKAVSPATKQPLDYYEFANTNGFWRRWPQLWSIANGDFCWVGNRPLNLIEAAELKTDFEKLWLNSPAGLFSYADALGKMDEFSDETRAHAAFYSATQNWRLDLTIFWNVLKHLCLPRKVPATLPQPTAINPKTAPVSHPIPAVSKLPIHVEGMTE